MAVNFHVDFPPEVRARRGRVQEETRRLVAEDTLETVRTAIRLQTVWLEQYPDDYVMWDVGEVLGKLEDAFLASQVQPALALSR